ncbi:MAG: hypothetical protein OEO19_04035 [Gammaproteobacteria bacterium]|nr:hypothetical protein [Gammaproteobacteria bacterium]MDH3446611.1 hypothetical protein [Gammaproteobacteria bacterium]
MIEYLVDGLLCYSSLAVFGIGVVWKLGSIVFASRAQDLPVARVAAAPAAFKTVFSRFIPHGEISRQIGIPLVAGYMSHLGLFALLFFAAPQVVFLEQSLFDRSARQYPGATAQPATTDDGKLRRDGPPWQYELVLRRWRGRQQ